MSERRSRPTCRPPSRPPSAVDLDALTPDPAALARFSSDLSTLAGAGPLGLAVSGGADSLALLLLAAAARPGQVEVLSVDHGLRRQAADEVASVGDLCAALGVPFHAVKLALPEGPDLQARARDARYAAIAEVAGARGLVAVATAHHADDQAETLMMRLGRGAGSAGLAGVRAAQTIDGLRVIRPLLGWTKDELADVCRAAGVAWADDPSNRDERFERARVRSQLSALDLGVEQVARSASHLAEAELALQWATQEASDRLLIDGHAARLDTDGLPGEIVRRLLLRAFALLGADPPRGPDLERATAALLAGRKASLSGLLLTPLSATSWHLGPEPARRA